jgi:hypothetical protein
MYIEDYTEIIKKAKECISKENKKLEEYEMNFQYEKHEIPFIIYENHYYL